MRKSNSFIITFFPTAMCPDFADKQTLVVSRIGGMLLLPRTNILGHSWVLVGSSTHVGMAISAAFVKAIEMLLRGAAKPLLELLLMDLPWKRK